MNTTRIGFLLTAGLVVPWLLAAGRSGGCGRSGNRIQPWSENPRYWQYQGQPVLLLGGSKDDNLFQIPDLKEHLDEMAAAGANYIRNTMSDRQDKGFEVYPFRQLPDGKYDLDQWNDEYWKRFENMLRWTAERDIIVQIEVWDRFDYSTATTGSRIPTTRRTTSTTPTSSRASPSTIRTIRAATSSRSSSPRPSSGTTRSCCRTSSGSWTRCSRHSLKYDHVLYCMDNETSAEEAWGAYWAEYHPPAGGRGRQAGLRDRDVGRLGSEVRRAPADASIIPSGTISSTSRRTTRRRARSTGTTSSGSASTSPRQPRPLNTVKTYGADGGRFGERPGRTRTLVAARARRRGLGALPPARFGPGAVRAGGRFASRAARKLESLDQALGRRTGQRTAQRSRGERGLPGRRAGRRLRPLLHQRRLRGAGSDQGIHGPFEVRWIDIRTGEWGKHETIQGGSVVTLRAPADGHWVAAIVRPKSARD